ncbi:hypothetical protein [Hymenobacter psychrophilus]|uniref:Uncharacterized protein n=1 Tax=Hymenobacter psychrophilus TaxID=651662 RepID=A0A1H3CPI3_9BACT|nr:hypothetical protein [Hymenobacter psychrophilus]SDX56063.1 hypothetical protein SAMN04488069_10268 [Hymenobacter psychrophilus]
MKNVLTLLALVALMASGTPTVAQADGGEQPTLAERATVMTWRIAERTQLSEGQYVKLRRLNVGLLSEMAMLRKQLKAEPANLDQSLADLLQRYEWDVAALLQPKQLAVYDGLKSEFTAVNIR